MKSFWQLGLLCLLAMTLLLTSCGGSNSSSPQAVSGVAAAGAPLIGTIYLKDSSSSPQEISTPIASDGSFSFNVSGLTAPFLLKAVGTVGVNSYTLYSFAAGSGIVNVNPLSNLAVVEANGGDLTSLYATPDPTKIQAIRNALTSNIAQIQAALQPTLSHFGAANQNFISSPYVANHSGLDLFLDLVSISVGNGTVTIVDKTTNNTISSSLSNFLTNTINIAPSVNNSVCILPINPSVSTSGTINFSAIVVGSANQQVSWSVVEANGGTITSAGVYTPPANAGTYHVIGTSVADGDKSATTSVTVTLPDWATFQGNAAHSGFVNTQLNPASFAQIWSWSRPAGDPEPVGGINSVATGAGKVFVSKDIYFGQGSLYALNEADGTVNWTYDLGPMASEGPPAYANGSVYVPSTDGAENCVVWAVDATLGTYRFKMPAPGQWSGYFAPTIFGGSVLQTSQAGVVYSFTTAGGSQQWSAPAGASDQTTPAADARYVYQYGTNNRSPALNVFDRVTGAPVASISDPFTTSFSEYSIFSAPMLGATGNVISFSDAGFSGRAASSSEQFESRILVNYDVAQKTFAWRSANAYLTHPAIANGVIYAARNVPATLDALSEADGHILWSWTPPTGNNSFHRNIVVTNNLVFASTDANIYAIDLNTRQAVWQYPQPGMMAISASSILYIATGATISDGHLVAIRLK